MTYATGSATTIANVMDAMSTFAQAHAGMTESVRRTETIVNSLALPESMTVICLTKGSSNWWFAYGLVDCRGFLADSDGGTVFFTTGAVQAPSVTLLSTIAAPFTSYHLFTEGTVVHVAFEMSSGAWTHLNFGDITKYGTWTGGSYLGAVTVVFFSGIFAVNGIFGDQQNNPFGAGQSTLTSKIRVSKGSRNYGNFDGYSATLNVNDGVTTPACAASWSPGLFDTILRDQPNVFNNRAMGVRMELFISDTNGIFSGGTNLWLPLGFVPNIRFVNIALLNPKDLINTDWMVFPIQAKSAISGFATTGNFGIAVRK